jgi:hypothetical protein
LPKLVYSTNSHAVVRYLDVVIVAVLALPVLALGAPVLGLLIGVAAWAGQRALQAADRHWLVRFQDPVQRLGFSYFEAFGRIWLLVGAIVLAAVIGGRSDGLAAVLVIFAGYTIFFISRLMSGPPPPRSAQR